MAAQLFLDQSQDALWNSYTLGHLADAAYSNDPENDPSFQETIFTKVALFHGGSSGLGHMHTFVTSDLENIAVVFRGTDQPSDWLTNLNFAMRPVTGGYVHTGFDEALDTIWDEVSAMACTPENIGKTLWVTGHSLGAALAVLAARRFQTADRLPFFVATFGQPRVGDSEYGDKFKSDLFRFVNNRDIVPTVPPRIVPGHLNPIKFYAHFGDLKFFKASGDLSSPKTKAALGLMEDMMEALGPFSTKASEAQAKELVRNALKDHKMANYLACLKKNLP